MKIDIGDHIVIKEMVDEPAYNGREGDVRYIDGMGQIHGTWGGCALIPGYDTFSVTSKAVMEAPEAENRLEPKPE